MSWNVAWKSVRATIIIHRIQSKFEEKERIAQNMCSRCSTFHGGSADVKAHALIIVYWEVWVETRTFPLHFAITYFHDNAKNLKLIYFTKFKGKVNSLIRVSLKGEGCGNFCHCQVLAGVETSINWRLQAGDQLWQRRPRQHRSPGDKVQMLEAAPIWPGQSEYFEVLLGNLRYF